MRINYKWVVALGLSTVLLGAIALVNNNTKQVELRLNKQIHQLEARTKAEQNAQVESLKKKIQEQDAKYKQLEQSKAAEKSRIAVETAAEAAKTSVVAKVVQTIVPTAQAATGLHTDWMAAAGISSSDYGYVEFIVSHESGWNPCSYYPGQSNCNAQPVSACGLVMQNPCGKIGGDWRDPIAALRWMNSYVARYGGFAGAYAHWLVYRTY